MVVSPLIIAVAAFVGVAALVGGVAIMLRDKPADRIEDRLDMLTRTNGTAAAKESPRKESSVLAKPLESGPGVFENLFNRFGDVRLLFEQADTSLTITRLALASIVLAVLGIAFGVILGIHPVLLPVPGVLMGVLPLFWLLWRRRKRLRAFAVQLPDALEMLARGLRSGQSLAAGFHMVAGEMSVPLGKEFGRVFEEQNLGIAMEDSLYAMAERIPNLDLRFFVTAVVLQRQTGGDLAEILDKIGRLIRERFQIWGQVQALTGEGRLSGVVLLALPIVLFLAVYQLNPDYVMLLFTEPMGKKMLAAAIILQVIGALVIRKIVNIKV